VADEFDIKGLEDLNKLAVDMGNAGLRVTRDAGTVVAKYAYAVEGSAKAFCPVDTGNLRNGISTTLSPNRLSAQIGPTASYAPFVEFGTSRMAPRAFMGPALDIQTPGFVAALEQISDPKL
jgi:HK97 gp10 family phage protein